MIALSISTAWVGPKAVRQRAWNGTDRGYFARRPILGLGLCVSEDLEAYHITTSSVSHPTHRAPT